jgi:hypothetical protein
MHLLSPIRLRRPTHFNLLYLKTRIFVEEYRAQRSSLCSLFHCPFASSLLGPNILLNNLFSRTPNLDFSLNVSDQVSDPYKTRQDYSSVYLDLYIFG